MDVLVLPSRYAHSVCGAVSDGPRADPMGCERLSMATSPVETRLLVSWVPRARSGAHVVET